MGSAGTNGLGLAGIAGLVVGVECMFAWYWLADLCAAEAIDFVLGHALYMRMIHGGKAKTDDTVSITSGILESSNVNPAQSLISMIELQRLYEFQIKSINSTDTNEQSAERLMLTS